MLVGTGAANNLVIGNFIGTNPKGNASLANLNGITIMAGANHNTIGDRAPGTGNLISGNQNDGVDISNGEDARAGDMGTSDNILMNNFIGTDRTGRKAVGNGLYGVEIEQGAFHNSVGDPQSNSSSDVNIISGNALAGVGIYGDHTAGNSINNCYIGTDVTGHKALPNYVGVIVADGANGNAIDNSTISRNTTDGIQIKGVGTDRNGIFGDYIEANGHDGISVSDGPKHTVIGGGDGARSEDYINKNGHDGVELTGDVSKTFIEFSRIQSNGADGIAIYGGHDNRIGDYGADTIDHVNIRIGNSIFNNAQSGIRLDGSTNNVIQANDIGAYDSFNKVDEGNAQYGIVITNGSAHNLIGTPLDYQALLGNNISYNQKGGVLIGSDSANPQAPEAGVGNIVLRNLIFANGANNNVDGIHLGWAGAQTANDLGDADSGANNLQNKPVITSATSSSFNTVVDGTLNSVGNATFRIEFFATDSKGQTMTFLTSIDFVAGPNAGTAFFEATFPIGNLQGQRIVATATNLTTGDTSEFSLPFLATSVLFQ